MYIDLVVLWCTAAKSYFVPSAQRPGKTCYLYWFVYIQMAESTESELSTESTEEKQSPVDFQMTEFKLSDQITEKEKQSRVVL